MRSSFSAQSLTKMAMQSKSLAQPDPLDGGKHLIDKHHLFIPCCTDTFNF
jgi:hypothetical protein